MYLYLYIFILCICSTSNFSTSYRKVMEFLFDYSIMMLSKKHRALSDVSYMYRSQAMLRTSACEQLSPKHKRHLTIKRRLSTSGKENRHLRTSLVCPRDQMLELKIRHIHLAGEVLFVQF